MNRTKRQKKAIVKIWLKRKDYIYKCHFADHHGISVPTINEWIRQYEKGELDE